MSKPWWVSHPNHMNGYEAFGTTERLAPIVRRLGHVTFNPKGPASTEETPGTDSFREDEVKNGVAGIHFSSYGDDPSVAYLYILGIDREAVEDRWHLARAQWLTLKDALWPSPPGAT